jgi:hypothetical protein
VRKIKIKDHTDWKIPPEEEQSTDKEIPWDLGQDGRDQEC